MEKEGEKEGEREGEKEGEREVKGGKCEHDDKKCCILLSVMLCDVMYCYMLSYLISSHVM